MDEIFDISLYGEDMSPQTLEAAKKYCDSLNISDTSDIANIGNACCASASSISDSLIIIAGRDDTSVAADSMNSISSAISDFSKSVKPGFMGRYTPAKIESIKENYKAAHIEILKTSASLETSKRQLTKTILMLEDLHKKNFVFFDNLKMLICSCEMKLADITDLTLPSLSHSYETNPSSELKMQIDLIKQNVRNLEIKMHDLKLSKTVCMQTAAQIFFLRDSCIKIRSRIGYILSCVVPLWETQVAITLGVANTSLQQSNIAGSIKKAAALNKKSAAEILTLASKVQSDLDETEKCISGAVAVKSNLSSGTTVQ